MRFYKIKTNWNYMTAFQFILNWFNEALTSKKIIFNLFIFLIYKHQRIYCRFRHAFSKICTSTSRHWNDIKEQKLLNFIETQLSSYQIIKTIKITLRLTITQFFPINTYDPTWAALTTVSSSINTWSPIWRGKNATL